MNSKNSFYKFRSKPYLSYYIKSQSLSTEQRPRMEEQRETQSISEQVLCQSGEGRKWKGKLLDYTPGKHGGLQVISN